MLQDAREKNRDRLKSALGVAVFHALLGYALLAGLGFDVSKEVSQQLKMFDVVEELPPPEIELPPPTGPMTEKKQTPNPEGSASPANLKDTPTPVVAPVPIVQLKVPPPIVAAPLAGQGNAPAVGAAAVPGPGTGAGGVGTGTGSGLYGNGNGGGGGGGSAVRAQQIRGSIDQDDYPRREFEAGAGGTVYLRFVVQPNGRVDGCRVTRSSGHPALDATTCRLIEKRFRYRPARDVWGRAIAEVVLGQHEWESDYRRTRVEIEEEE
jgi:protein TonB